MIFVSLIATVGLLTFFSWFYNRFSVKSAHHPFAKFWRKSVLEYCSLHFIYAINIMTNQGKIIIHFHSFHSFNLK